MKPTDTPEVKRQSTGRTLMALKAKITTATGQSWLNVSRLQPVFQDDPYSDFRVYARTNGQSEFVGEYPGELSEEEQGVVVDELVALLAQANAEPPPVELGPDGESYGDPRVEGKQVTIGLPTGRRVTTIPRRKVPPESEEQQEARLRTDLAAMPMVVVYVEGIEYVGWNGLEWWLQPGPNTVPQVVADVFYQNRMARSPLILDEASRIAAGKYPLPTRDELDAYIYAETPKR